MNGTIILQGSNGTNSNESGILPDPMIGYIFQNDIVASKQALSLPNVDYTDTSQHEQLVTALKR